MTLDISLGVLSWRAPETLRATLKSFSDVGFDRLFADRRVLIQESEPASQAAAAQFGFLADNLSENLGILGGFETLARSTTQDIILLVENDFRLSVSFDDARSQLQKAHALIASGEADLVQMRSRKEPGDPFTVKSKYEQLFPDQKAPVQTRVLAALRRTLRPAKADRYRVLATRFRDDAPALAPQALDDLGDGFHRASSADLPWTNNPFLVRRAFFLKTIIAQAHAAQTTRRTNGFKNLEIEMNSPWWRQQEFKIVQCPGLFTHGRIGHRGY